MAEVYLGSIMMFGGNFAINGFAFCNGQTLSITSNTALFSLIGTYYGGNGTSTFQLPNLQGRVPMHQGNGAGLTPRVIGEIGGTENATLLVNNMPGHNHSVNAYSGSGTASNPTNAIPATGGKPDYYTTSAGNVTMAPGMIGTSGGSIPFSIMNPFLCINFLIALVGIFPSRN